MSKLLVASVMICGKPKHLNGRFMLSCSDAVWAPVEELPSDLNAFFTDELGNQTIQGSGFLQMVNSGALNLLSMHNLYACFRCVFEEDLDRVQTCPPTEVYRRMMSDLEPMGWDIATGNGWLSASCHGCFPINPFTGLEVDSNANKVNRYGLLSSESDCRAYCDVNNEAIPEHAPWYPVAIYVDQSSYMRLRTL